MRRALWLALGILLGAGAPALAQGLYAEGDFSCLVGVEWKSECYKPDFALASPDDASMIQADYDEYQDCVVRKAKSDSAYASHAVIESAKRELDDAKEEATAAGWSVQ